MVGALTGLLFATVIDMNETCRDDHVHMRGLEPWIFWIVVSVLGAMCLAALSDTINLARGKPSLTEAIGGRTVTCMIMIACVAGEVIIGWVRSDVRMRREPQ